jgi:arrestin-related trafficking adapter 3/6
MNSPHSLLWSPTEIGYKQVRSERGRLFYLPLYLTLHDGPGSRRLFAERARRPHRIHIARVHASYGLTDDFPFTKSRSSTAIFIEKTFDKAFGKLANPRDNARRLLKSFIAPLPPPPPNPHADDPLATTGTEVETRPRRRSWLTGKRRSTLVEAESMRSTSNRSSLIEPLASTTTTAANTTSERATPRPSLSESTRNWGSSVVDQAMRAQSLVRIPDEKPLASGNGVSVGISLAEPVLFLQGFDQAELSQRSTAMLRGSLHLKVTKASKIKAVTLKFKGQATTKWPEGTFLASNDRSLQTDPNKFGRHTSEEAGDGRDRYHHEPHLAFL